MAADYTADPDCLLLCEFCEQKGPTKILEFPCMDNVQLGHTLRGEAGGTPSSSPAKNDASLNVSPQSISRPVTPRKSKDPDKREQKLRNYSARRAEAINNFAMRALASDPVYDDVTEIGVEGYDGEGARRKSPASAPTRRHRNIFSRKSELFIDRVEWAAVEKRGKLYPTYAAAFVLGFTLPDIQARGYTRTMCFCYLSGNHTKLMAISHWISTELEIVYNKMKFATEMLHEKELEEAVRAFEYFCAYQASRSPNSRESSAPVSAASSPKGDVPSPTDAHPELNRRHLQNLDGERQSLSNRLVSLQAQNGVRLHKFRRSSNMSPRAEGSVPASTALMASARVAINKSSSDLFAPSGQSFNRSTNARPISATATPSAQQQAAAKSSEEDNSPLHREHTHNLLESPSHEKRVSCNFPELCQSSGLMGVSIEKAWEYFAIVDHLLTKKGERPLRTMDKYINTEVLTYADVVARLKYILYRYCQEHWWILEAVDERMVPMATLDISARADKFARDILGAATPLDALTPRHNESSANDQPLTFFNIGDFPICAPLAPFNQSHVNENLFNRTILKRYDIHAFFQRTPFWKHVMFNALKGRPIIVCASDKGVVSEGIKFISTFVPGLCQTSFLRVAILPFSDSQHYTLKAELFGYYIVVGCPRWAALQLQKDGTAVAPLFPQAAVWDMEHSLFYGESYGGSAAASRSGFGSSISKMFAGSKQGGSAQQVQVHSPTASTAPAFNKKEGSVGRDRSNTETARRVSPANELEQGLLNQLDGWVERELLGSPEDAFMLLMELKSVLHRYGTMAQQCFQTLMSKGERIFQDTTNLPYISSSSSSNISFRKKASTSGMDLPPSDPPTGSNNGSFGGEEMPTEDGSPSISTKDGRSSFDFEVPSHATITPRLVTKILCGYHGYRTIFPFDVLIVVYVVKCMIQVIADAERAGASKEMEAAAGAPRPANPRGDAYRVRSGSIVSASGQQDSEGTTIGVELPVLPVDHMKRVTIAQKGGQVTVTPFQTESIF